MLTTGSGGGFDSLIIEPAITQHFPQLLRVLTESGIADPALAQDLLDELAGAIEAGLRGERSKVGSPSSWLKAAVGELKRARCFEIQARRRLAQENEHRRKLADTPVSIDPNSSAKGAEMFAAARRRRESKSEVNNDNR